MKKVLHTLGAAVAGVMAGGIVVALVEGLSSAFHPMPKGMNMNDPEQMKAFVATLPTSAFLFVVAAWAAGALTAASVAKFLAPGRGLLPPVIALGALSLATIAMLLAIPHPLWMWFAGVAVWPVFGVLGMLLVPNDPKSLVVGTAREVSAPISKVFAVLSTAEEFQKAIPGVVKIEFLTEQRRGAGTKMRETRLMNGRECAVVLEMTECIDNDRVRMVSDMGGVVWDTVFTVAPTSSSSSTPVRLTMEMHARPHSPLGHLLAPAFVGMCGKGVAADMDAVKAYCERQG